LLLQLVLIFFEFYRLPTLKELSTGNIHESELTSSFIHPLLQSLLATDHDDRVARWYVLNLPHLLAAIFFLLFTMFLFFLSANIIICYIECNNKD
jgi:hypothetical protein